MKDPIGDMNKRIDELEKLQNQDILNLQNLQNAVNTVSSRLTARQGALEELRRFLQAEVVEIKPGEVKDEKKD